ncbi:sigma-70 family RNA polymerase sigma factor [Polaribacter batillariae]|uniref:Sigma-70 family RNA polymerase sigma factor n=1 Tax=Polaribacter batillariae TaxID=2808900 RepID=A0ABX7SQR0_9FLAO|nr:sigma-70 family RNA polymerase sigma factor [Polaribacter batillariae]QTD36560.1 sigma-70 family RNA polymerase sigma factor [Polaribacter batillariae]
MKEHLILEELKKGNNMVLEKVYLDYKKPFFNYAKKFTLSEEDILDIYQDAILAFIENIKTGKLVRLNSSIKTYLFSIGKYVIYNKIKKENTLQIVNSFKESDLKTAKEHEVLFLQELTDEQQLLKKSFGLLGKKCQQILTLFYFRGFNLEEITAHLGYNHKNVVKSQKSRCLKSLKDKMI